MVSILTSIRALSNVLAKLVGLLSTDTWQPYEVYGSRLTGSVWGRSGKTDNI